MYSRDPNRDLCVAESSIHVILVGRYVDPAQMIALFPPYFELRVTRHLRFFPN